LPEKAKIALETDAQIEAIAERHKAMPLCFFLGRGADAAVALEAALKLKEVAYVPTQESPAGEMKHGPLALVQPGVVAVFGATDPSTLDKVVSNMKEVQARGGTVIGVTTNEDTTVERAADETIKVPATPFEFLNAVLSIIPLQLFAYHVARKNGCEIDQPRNLAKSVTVE
jgi:glucosamine--fructose-6-phosphate aminotransferase (isomerizing)